ncbi:hypothetical protein JOB18_039100 [Solea senegalensis]|uniref:Uncharacterized protein n=1 Tax=Solea senegalensis TaxID=28829 RepID=A0AAV6PTW6_SOLSE|nr:hypothetical protein JOB18_039100 [Solea senegalensis]
MATRKDGEADTSGSHSLTERAVKPEATKWEEEGGKVQEKRRTQGCRCGGAAGVAFIILHSWEQRRPQRQPCACVSVVLAVTSLQACV